jgi:hypothetical protein
MATPLYKRLKNRGTTFYAFPSASEDWNLANNSNQQYKLNFTKFVLLNFPTQEIVTEGVENYDQTKGKMNFDKDQNGPKFFNFQPGGNGDLPSKFSEQLIESLRNYVANYDSTLRESRVNSNTDFYNINELTNPTEMIFWKWIKKLNLIDFEPALHKIDWDKNLADFNNNNGNDFDYFNKYLWKERDVNYYTVANINNDSATETSITLNVAAKFKVGDKICFSGNTGTSGGVGFLADDTTSYEILSISIDQTGTTFVINTGTTAGNPSNYNLLTFLNYNKLIQYIGEIQFDSKVQTSKRNVSEITAYIPHHAGKTPNILFRVEDNSNYQPDLEMPILPEEQQEEIVGAENTNSPIRLSPQDYPGTHYGYFDTEDKTYKCTSGDRLRHKGDYYGIKLTNNIGLDAENYFEKLSDFNSNEIDGLKLDFDRDHYLKMNLPNTLIKNFDDFNSAYFDGAPEDFYFNAILWYYDLDDGSGNIYTNLFGIEFLNNPEDDDDECDYNYRLITPYRKLVSNGTQDGLSYTFNLNINTSIDNNVTALSYDPTTIYNSFGFDLYQNILKSNADIIQNYLTIITGFTYINEEILNLKSLIYSQTDIDRINSQIQNLNSLLTLYSTMQFVDSDTAKIETNFDTVYPTLKFNVVDTLYQEITNVNISDVYEYNISNSGIGYIVNVPLQSQLMLNILNNNNTFNEPAKIVLNRDLQYKQALDIFIKPQMSEISNKLNIDLMFDSGDGTLIQTNILSGVTLPTDLFDYDTLNISNSVYNNAYYNNSNLNTYSKNITTGSSLTTIDVMEDLFEVGDYIYIDNLFLSSGNTVLDYSNVYLISGHTSGTTTGQIQISLDTSNLSLRSKLKISYYKGIKINILRISSLDSSLINDRYKITKELL